MRVAFVHDYLTQFGGAERVLLELHRLYPSAPIYTSIYNPASCGEHFGHVDVRTSWLQHVPGAQRNFRALLALYPGAFASMDLRAFDLVISSTTSFAKGVRVGPQTLHVSYMHTPTRFLWYPEEYARELIPLLARPAFAVITPWLRRWDYEAAQRPTYIVANSQNVAERIRAIYHRSSDVVHCPADVATFTGSEPVEGYYLVMSRLLPYKRVALAIAATEVIGAPLIIAGGGPEERPLRGQAHRNVTFAGRVSDEERRRLIMRARAVIIPGIEDFGLVALEAAAAGRPTVAFAAGGALETVVEGETGLFFREPSARSLAQALQRLAEYSFDRAHMQLHARRFAPEAFRSRFASLIERYVHDFAGRRLEAT